MKKLLLFLLVILVLPAFGQYKKKKPDPFPKPPRFEQKGWFFAPGDSYTINNFSTSNQYSPSGVSSALTPKGRIGYYLEGGRYKLTNRLYFIRYIDYGLNVKSIRGAEGFVNTDSTGSQVSSGTNTFGDHSASAFLNANNVIPISQKWFVQNTIGLSAEYAFLNNRTNINAVQQPVYPNNLRGELTYKIGFGYKYSNYLLIIPSIQTSLLQVYPWSGVNLTLPFFKSWYKPVFFSVRFLFLRNPRVKKCPPVDALGVPEDYEEQE